MKKIILMVFVLFASRIFCQTIKCPQLQVRNIYAISTDSIVKVLIHFSDSDGVHINYPRVTSILGQEKKDILSRASSDYYYAQMPNSLLKYSLPAHGNWKSNNSYIVNIEYKDLGGNPGLHSCPLIYNLKDSLVCSYLKLANDTVSIDFSKNTTDLKFTYEGRPFHYPNYLFQTKAPELNIAKGFSQTYMLSKEFEYCIDTECDYLTPVHRGMVFETNIKTVTYVPGRFIVGYLDKNTCPYNITFKLNPTIPAGMSDVDLEKIVFFPNPIDDILHVINRNNITYVVTDVTGKELLKGIVNNEQIQLDLLKTGLYFIQIGLTNYKIFIK